MDRKYLGAGILRRGGSSVQDPVSQWRWGHCVARPNRMAPYYAAMLRIFRSSDYFASLLEGF